MLFFIPWTSLCIVGVEERLEEGQESGRKQEGKGRKGEAINRASSTLLYLCLPRGAERYIQGDGELAACCSILTREGAGWKGMGSLSWLGEGSSVELDLLLLLRCRSAAVSF